MPHKHFLVKHLVIFGFRKCLHEELFQGEGVDDPEPNQGRFF